MLPTGSTAPPPAGTLATVDPRLTFFFYLGALVCFALAAAGGRVGGGRASVGLVPLGLGLWLFPLVWTTGVAAF